MSECQSKRLQIRRDLQLDACYGYGWFFTFYVNGTQPTYLPICSSLSTNENVRVGTYEYTIPVFLVETFYAIASRYYCYECCDFE